MRDDYGYSVEASPEVLANLREEFESSDDIEEYAKSIGVEPPPGSSGSMWLAFDPDGNEIGLYWQAEEEPAVQPETA